MVLDVEGGWNSFWNCPHSLGPNLWQSKIFNSKSCTETREWSGYGASWVIELCCRNRDSWVEFSITTTSTFFFFFGVFVFLGEIKNVGMLGEDLGIWRWFSWIIFLLVENYVWDFSGYWNLVEMLLLLLGKRGTKDIVYVWWLWVCGWLLAGCLTLGFDCTYYYSCQYYTICDTYHIVYEKFCIVSMYRKCSLIVRYSVCIGWIV